MIALLLAAAFEILPLIDELDWDLVNDMERTNGLVKTMDAIMRTHPTTILWRDKGGGRYWMPTREEHFPNTEQPLDKRQIPSLSQLGYFRPDRPDFAMFPFLEAESVRRNVGFGIHTGFEENHQIPWSEPAWNIHHPEFFCRNRAGMPRPASVSLAFPEVFAHKMRLVDERLEHNPEIVFLDLHRAGGWSVDLEYVKPVCDRWRARYGCEPPEDAHDPRWISLCSEDVMRYLRAFAARCRAHGTRFLLGIQKVEIGYDYMWDRYGIDWKTLAKEGAIDGLVVMGVKPDKARPFESTKEILSCVKANCGATKLYFQASVYPSNHGFTSYAKATGLDTVTCMRRELEIAREVGCSGVILECVDPGTYSDAQCELLRLARQEPVDFVDPYVGCADNGHCFAAACTPFGLIQAGPDTGFLWWDYCSGYRYADTNIIGFSQTHLSGTGCGDLGDLRLMPFTGAVDLTRTNFASSYRKATQTAQPGFYGVTLDDNHAKVALAAAPHSALYEISYLGADLPRLLVDLQYGILNWTARKPDNRVISCTVRQTDDRTLAGTVRTKVWVDRAYSFVLTFDHAIRTRQDLPPQAATERAPRFVLTFDLPAGGCLKAKLALSSRNEQGARKNLAAEIPDWNLTALRQKARADWNAQLGCLRADGDATQLKTFYTSLYHLFIQPNNIADVGEEPFYSTFSYWDTFRAAHPLCTLIASERVDDFVRSTLRQAETQGYMPIWTLWGKDNHCMIGSHSIPVVVDAYLKGFRGFDAAQAYALIRKSLTEDVPGRPFNFTAVWSRYGYYPFDIVKYESVSRTLEHAYDEWCAARLAAALGKTDDVAFFDSRACNWTNVFDRTVGFARGRDTHGIWREPFSPFKLNVGGRGAGPKDFTEGNSWQYTWHVMQNPAGLIAAMGGRDKFLKTLNGLFIQPEKVAGMGFALDATGLIGQYAHGNEPSHHTAYFFPFAGRRDRTAEIVREICDRFYRPEPDGLCGNDDCGQMSAWYLFSAMGFYPFNPCGGDYVIGAPQVPQVLVRLPQGKTLCVRANGLSKACKYVKSVSFNGQPVKGFILRHADLVQGGDLVFEMSAHP